MSAFGDGRGGHGGQVHTFSTDFSTDFSKLYGDISAPEPAPVEPAPVAPAVSFVTRSGTVDEAPYDMLSFRVILTPLFFAVFPAMNLSMWYTEKTCPRRRRWIIRISSSPMILLFRFIALKTASVGARGKEGREPGRLGKGSGSESEREREREREKRVEE